MGEAADVLISVIVPVKDEQVAIQPFVAGGPPGGAARPAPPGGPGSAWCGAGGRG